MEGVYRLVLGKTIPLFIAEDDDKFLGSRVLEVFSIFSWTWLTLKVLS